MMSLLSRGWIVGVDFPQPEGPMTATTSPAATPMLICGSAGGAPDWQVLATCPGDNDSPAPGGQFDWPNPGPSAWAADRRPGRHRSQPRARSPARMSYSRRHADRRVMLITWPGPTVPPIGLFIASPRAWCLSGLQGLAHGDPATESQNVAGVGPPGLPDEAVRRGERVGDRHKGEGGPATVGLPPGGRRQPRLPRTRSRRRRSRGETTA